jgi:hypothetical protein
MNISTTSNWAASGCEVFRQHVREYVREVSNLAGILFSSLSESKAFVVDAKSLLHCRDKLRR